MRGLNRWWADRPLRTKGLIVIAIPLAALVGSAPLVFSEIRTAEELNDRVRLTIQVDAQIQTVLVSLLDAETGVRGYASTHQTKFLEPYHEALGVLAGETSTLSALVAGDPAQSLRASNVEQLSRQELNGLSYLREIDGRTKEEVATLLTGQDPGSRSSTASRLRARDHPKRQSRRLGSSMA